ncbi:helix-turn-helix domain-containing protein [Nordella sp. HKS 07]|uniref:GlxA family transcriptional regulator n=1 Tax=Nordella sp. HKS 07 TaxID=2712222 RepID=UPI0013E201AD|nr:helix-turn-helix domain-containing protein [Nordella sp. HKS 07]QIG46733.1 helix-turn-helix domain-containing protein [Nordella sp. HKS 07]
MDETADPLRISLLALPETTPAAVYGLYEVLSSVGSIWDRLTGQETKVRRIAPAIVAPRKQTFNCAIGTPITPHASLTEARDSDVVIVTDLALPLADDAPARWADTMAWLTDMSAAGATICSVCTGSILLAEAGLLDGKDAASHWIAADIFRDRYPKVRFRPERIICDTAAGGRLITTGGASSWGELALHLIARYCGREEASRIARIYLLGDRSSGQLPFAAMANPRRHEDAVIERCQRWIADHYAQAHPVARLVAVSGLPERTFKRRFKAATGYAPVDYVQSLRIEEAKQMLEASAEPTEAIALAVGYEDPAFFRRLFKRHAGITPAQYRQRYRSISDSRI